jgi:hypothetical protein
MIRVEDAVPKGLQMRYHLWSNCLRGFSAELSDC